MTMIREPASDTAGVKADEPAPRRSLLMIEGRGRHVTYHFRIRTASGGIVNTSQWASDAERAKYLLLKRYPGATIINMF
jgi:hypothetical protein